MTSKPEIPQILTSLTGLKLVGVTPSFLTMISLELGEGDTVRNVLWLYNSDWDFVSDDMEILSSDSYEPRSQPMVKDFMGSKIEEVYLFPGDEDHEIHFYFSNGGRLAIWANKDIYDYQEETDLFILFKVTNSKEETIYTYPGKLPDGREN